MGKRRAANAIALMQRARTMTSVLKTRKMPSHLRAPSFANGTQRNPATNTAVKNKSTRGRMIQSAINACNKGRFRLTPRLEDSAMRQIK